MDESRSAPAPQESEARGESEWFRAGDEKVLVDGREQVRTETVFKDDGEPAAKAAAPPAATAPGSGKAPERRAPQP